MKHNGYVIIEGNIGVGKSTFARYITNALRDLGCTSTLLLEPADDNPYLPLYYEDAAKHAYEMQSYLLAKRYAMTQFAQWGAMADMGWFIMDRSYFGDLYFAKVQKKDGFFNDLNFKTYKSNHACMQTNIKMPTAAIFLDARPETCKRRADGRGRDCEKGLPLEYLQSLDVEICKLKAFLSKMTEVLTLPWNADQDDACLKRCAAMVAELLTQDDDVENDFYSPWDVCAPEVFAVDEQVGTDG